EANEYHTIPDAAAQMFGARVAGVPRSDAGSLGRATSADLRPAGFGGTGTARASRWSARAHERLGTWLDPAKSDLDTRASNEFAVGARRSASGKPMLANDPHLALATPDPLYVVHVSVPGIVDAIGACVPGLPTIVSGRNRRAAWGITALSADVIDVYADTLSANGRHVRWNGGWKALREEPF